MSPCRCRGVVIKCRINFPISWHSWFHASQFYLSTTSIFIVLISLIIFAPSYFCSLGHSMFRISKSCFLAWVVYLRLLFGAWCLVFFSIFLFFSDERGAGPLHQPPNLEGQVIFGQGFLPLALDNSISNCWAAVLILVHPGHFISPVPTISGERSPIHHLGRRLTGD